MAASIRVAAAGLSPAIEIAHVSGALSAAGCRTTVTSGRPSRSPADARVVSRARSRSGLAAMLPAPRRSSAATSRSASTRPSWTAYGCVAGASPPRPSDGVASASIDALLRNGSRGTATRGRGVGIGDIVPTVPPDAPPSPSAEGPVGTDPRVPVEGRGPHLTGRDRGRWAMIAVVDEPSAATGAPPIPSRFPAYVVERDGDRFERGLRDLTPDDLPPGEVVVRVGWSSVNFKDGLAARSDGRVARISPLVPGIDLAGEVIASEDPAFRPGDPVLAHGYDLGVARHGGFSAFERLPSGWVVPLPDGLGAREAMAIGTAGYTAAAGIVALEARGLMPSSGPVLVTGASGGVGRMALAILARRGYEVWAATGKPDATARLRALGAAGILGRDEVTAESPKPLESARWAGAIDAVGGPTLPYVLRTLAPGAAVAACGNAGGAAFGTTVLPFILRGVALLGIDSVPVPIAERRALWGRLATDLRPGGLGEDVTEVDLAGLEPALDAVVAGQARGRWVVRVGEE